MAAAICAVFAAAVGATPAALRAQSFDDLMRIGRAQRDSGKSDDAVKTFEKAVQANPQSPDAHVQLGRAVGDVVQKANVFRQPFLAKRVKSEFEKAIELDPANVNAHDGLLEFYLQAPGVMGGSVAGAREQAAAIGKINPLHGHLADALIANHEKDVAGAEKAYRAAVADSPDSLVALQGLVSFLNGHERAEETFEPIERYLAQKPDDRVALFYFGRAAAITGKQLDRGEQSLKTVLATPDAPHTRIALEAVHLRLGDIAAKRGDKVKARAEYTEALKINPKFELAKKALAGL